MHQRKLTEDTVHRIIEMAWEDRTPIDAIKKQFFLTEKQIITLMRKHLHPTSFKNWRKFHSENKNLFFNLGPDNNWEKILKKKISNEIENYFEEEMMNLGYL